MVKTFEFRLMYLPYCLLLQADGSYVVCNRRNQPVGGALVSYLTVVENQPKVRFARKLTAGQIAFLSCTGDTSPERISLYNDGSVPTSSAAAWAAYSRRLERLASYKLVTVEG